MFIDSDDFCEPEMVELCIKGMDKEDADMAVFAYNQYYVETNSKEKIDLSIPSGTYTLEKRPEILAKTPNALGIRCIEQNCLSIIILNIHLVIVIKI